MSHKFPKPICILFLKEEEGRRDGRDGGSRGRFLLVIYFWYAFLPVFRAMRTKEFLQKANTKHLRI